MGKVSRRSRDERGAAQSCQVARVMSPLPCLIPYYAVYLLLYVQQGAAIYEIIKYYHLILGSRVFIKQAARLIGVEKRAVRRGYNGAEAAHEAAHGLWIGIEAHGRGLAVGGEYLHLLGNKVGKFVALAQYAYGAIVRQGAKAHNRFAA